MEKVFTAEFQWNEEEDPLAYPFPRFLMQSKEAGRDVNEWLEDVEGWPAAEPIFNALIKEKLTKESVVCELGPGTGRWTKSFLEVVDFSCGGMVHLVDHSPWIVCFLSHYFRDKTNVQTHMSDGQSLPLCSNSLDLVFSGGVLFGLKVGHL